MEKKYDSTHIERSGIYTGEINQKYKEPYYQTSDSYEHQSIKLDTIKKRKSQFEKLKFKGKKISMTCYACSKSNYIARNCQLSNKV